MVGMFDVGGNVLGSLVGKGADCSVGSGVGSGVIRVGGTVGSGVGFCVGRGVLGTLVG